MQYAYVKNRMLFFWGCVIAASVLFFALFSNICFPFIFGFIIAYIIVPFVDVLSQNKYTGVVGRSFWSLLFSIGTVMIFIVGAIILVPKLRDYLIFLSGKLPQYYSLFVSFINDKFPFINIDESDIVHIKAEIQKFLDQKIYFLASIIEGVASKGKAITKFLSFFIVMPVSLFYFLKDWKHMSDKLLECVPLNQRVSVIEVISIIRRTVSRFLYWQFYIVFSLFVYYAVALSFVGIDHSLHLALTSGLLSFIPFIGCIFSSFLAIFVSIPVMSLTKFYCIIAIYFVGQFIEGYVLYPHFVGKNTGLHPLWILFSFFAGAELGGLIGVLIAIPSAAVIRNLCSYVVRKFKATRTYKEQ